MEEMKCEFTNCDKIATWHFTSAKKRAQIDCWHLCEEHGKYRVKDYIPPMTQKIDIPCKIKDGIYFDIEFLFCNENEDPETGIGHVFLIELGGSRRIDLKTGPFEWHVLNLEIKKYQAPRPLTHRAMVLMMRALGGQLEHILLDNYFPENIMYEAKLHIQQNNSPVIVDVRPTDAIALAIICDVPIIVSNDVLLKLEKNGLK